MKKSEKIFSIIIGLIILFIIYYSFQKNKKLSKGEVDFISAKVDRIFETENGFIYDFTYYCNGKSYHSGYKSFFKVFDSVIYLKVLKSNPKIFEIIDY